MEDAVRHFTDEVVHGDYGDYWFHITDRELVQLVHGTCDACGPNKERKINLQVVTKK